MIENNSRSSNKPNGEVIGNPLNTQQQGNDIQKDQLNLPPKIATNDIPLKGLKNIYQLNRNISLLAEQKVKNFDEKDKKANIEYINLTRKKSIYKSNTPDYQSSIQNNIELMKIENIENKSKQLKKKIDIQKKSTWFKIKKFVDQVLDSNIYIIIMMIINIFILFISDIQNGWLSHNSDTAIEITQTIIFSIYCVEIVITSICKDGYVNSFFFWLDILSTVYIIQDISFIIYPIAGIKFDYL